MVCMACITQMVNRPMGNDTRRNHIGCQSRKDKYKKSGCKRPDLRIESFFVFWEMPELKDKPDQLESLLL